MVMEDKKRKKQQRPKKLIEHNGKSISTIFWDGTFTEEEAKQLKADYYKKPELQEVQRAFRALSKGKGNMVKPIIDYYIKELMNDTVMYHSKWSVNEVFDNLDLIRIFVDKVRRAPKTFDPKTKFEHNIDASFRLGGKGIAVRPSNFDIKVVKEVLAKYNLNNNYYDPSCGWSIRMLGSLSSNVNYFGTDPNTKLVPVLKEMANEFIKEMEIQTTVDIRNQGSEVFVPEWENKMGLIFTSPPYFFLEDYKYGAQSTKDRTYEQWLDEYMMGSIKNYDKYLIKNGHIIINIKDYDKFTLEADTIKCFEKSGFKLVDNLKFTNITRIAGSNDGKFTVDNDETMFVFQRVGDEPLKEETLEDW